MIQQSGSMSIFAASLLFRCGRKIGDKKFGKYVHIAIGDADDISRAT